MSVEQVARDFVMNMFNESKAKAMLAPGAMGDGGVLPAPMPLADSFAFAKALITAFPDMKMDVKQVTVNGDQATVKVQWGGTNSGALSFPMPGMPSLPATGKKVSVMDGYVVTVKNDKITHMTVDSPMDGGIPAAMAQLGIKMPGM